MLECKLASQDGRLIPRVKGRDARMLYLSRRRGESFSIEHPAGLVVVTIVKTGAEVLLGIDAPRDVRIARNPGDLHGLRVVNFTSADPPRAA